jgi:hypothetical protein
MNEVRRLPWLRSSRLKSKKSCLYEDLPVYTRVPKITPYSKVTQPKFFKYVFSVLHMRTAYPVQIIIFI